MNLTPIYSVYPIAPHLVTSGTYCVRISPTPSAGKNLPLGNTKKYIDNNYMFL